MDIVRHRGGLPVGEQMGYLWKMKSIKPAKINHVPKTGILDKDYLTHATETRSKLQTDFKLSDFNGFLDLTIMIGDTDGMEYAVRCFESHPALSAPVFNDPANMVKLYERLSRGYRNGAERQRRSYLGIKDSPDVEKAREYAKEAIELWGKFQRMNQVISELKKNN